MTPTVTKNVDVLVFRAVCELYHVESGRWMNGGDIGLLAFHDVLTNADYTSPSGLPFGTYTHVRLSVCFGLALGFHIPLRVTTGDRISIGRGFLELRELARDMALASMMSMSSQDDEITAVVPRPSQEQKVCDCKGSGFYVGLGTRSLCQTCDGSGWL